MDGLTVSSFCRYLFDVDDVADIDDDDDTPTEEIFKSSSDYQRERERKKNSKGQTQMSESSCMKRNQMCTGGFKYSLRLVPTLPCSISLANVFAGFSSSEIGPNPQLFVVLTGRGG